MLEFSLLTPGGSLFQGEVEFVAARGVEGELGILPGHMPLVTRLEPGLLRVRLPGEERRFRLPGGTLQVDGERVLVLTDQAEVVT